MDIEGIILKGVAGSYNILLTDGTVIEATACGRFRKEKITPLVGDRVALEQIHTKGENAWRMADILPRTNQLNRPPMANVSTLVIVLTPAKPAPDLLLADELICHCRLHDIRPMVCINKKDIDPAGAEELEREYAACGIETVVTCAQKKQGVERLADKLSGGLNCFCGQSAVGKSSLLNILLPEQTLETGGLSKKTDRGRHTTRHSEIWLLPDGKPVADTPGFSLLGTLEMPPGELAELYPEFLPFAENCRFRDCVHTGQKGCAVETAVKHGLLPKGRYDRYAAIYNTLLEKWRNRYD